MPENTVTPDGHAWTGASMFCPSTGAMRHAGRSKFDLAARIMGERAPPAPNYRHDFYCEHGVFGASAPDAPPAIHYQHTPARLEVFHEVRMLRNRVQYGETDCPGSVMDLDEATEQSRALLREKYPAEHEMLKTMAGERKR